MKQQAGDTVSTPIFFPVFILILLVVVVLMCRWALGDAEERKDDRRVCTDRCLPGKVVGCGTTPETTLCKSGDKHYRPVEK